MNKNREEKITNLMKDFAKHGFIAKNFELEDVEIYYNAYQQKPKLFKAIEDMFNEYINGNDFEPSSLMWKLFKTYFNDVWFYATNSYYEGYPLPEKMEFVNLLDLDIDLI